VEEREGAGPTLVLLALSFVNNFLGPPMIQHYIANQPPQSLGSFRTHQSADMGDAGSLR